MIYPTSQDGSLNYTKIPCRHIADGGHFYFTQKGLGLFCSRGSSELASRGQSASAFPDGTRYIFLTNNLTASAETIAELYRNRWSVELFFKWIKQHLRIKKFWGTSENAVRIQIYCAIITYCLVAIVQHDMKLERSIYEVLQILGISLTDKTCLRDLFDKSNFKNVNVLCDSSEPNLFNF